MQFLSKNNIIMIVLSISAAGIFAVDLFIPLGLIIWLGYIPLIFLSLFLKDRKFLKLLDCLKLMEYVLSGGLFLPVVISNQDG